MRRRRDSASSCLSDVSSSEEETRGPSEAMPEGMRSHRNWTLMRNEEEEATSFLFPSLASVLSGQMSGRKYGESTKRERDNFSLPLDVVCEYKAVAAAAADDLD